MERCVKGADAHRKPWGPVQAVLEDKPRSGNAHRDDICVFSDELTIAEHANRIVVSSDATTEAAVGGSKRGSIDNQHPARLIFARCSVEFQAFQYERGICR
jgi:hypothetical protein